MSSSMLPPSPRVPQLEKKWCSMDTNAAPCDLGLPFTSTPSTPPRQIDTPQHRPPMSVVVIQGTPSEEPLWTASPRGRDCFGSGRSVVSSSPFSSVSRLMPRRPLPVTTCVSPSTNGERKRPACSIASSSIDELTYYSSPDRGPKLPGIPGRGHYRNASIPCGTPYRSSARAAKNARLSPMMDMDFMALENLSLQSPVPRKLSATAPSPPSTVCVRERGNSFSDYIASPARSLHSSFSDYVASPAQHPPHAPPKSRTPSIDSSAGSGSCAKSTTPSPRKVRLKVLSQVSPIKKQVQEPFKLASPQPIRFSRKHQSSTSLAYSLDGSECSNENLPSFKNRLPPLGADESPMSYNREMAVTPRKLDPNTPPSRKYSPRKMVSKTSYLSPRTPLPKISLTPRSGKKDLGLLPRKPLSNLPTTTPGPPQVVDGAGPFTTSLFGTFTRSPQEKSRTSRSSTYNVSPRMLFPHGSRLLTEGRADVLLNQSIEASIAESLRSNMSYMSDSDDDEGFVLASPATIKEQFTRRRRGSFAARSPKNSRL